MGQYLAGSPCFRVRKPELVSPPGFLSFYGKRQACLVGFPLSRQNRKNQGQARNPEIFRVLAKVTLSDLVTAIWLSWVRVFRTPTMSLKNRPKYSMFNHTHCLWDISLWETHGNVWVKMVCRPLDSSQWGTWHVWGLLCPHFPSSLLASPPPPH